MSGLDLFILVFYFAAVLFLGLSASKSVKTLEDYATGGRFYCAFFIFATLSSSFIGGGFTSGLATKVYASGLLYVVALWGFSLKELLIARYIAPRMSSFNEAISVGDIMGSLYGQNARLLTGIASVLLCAGIACAQFSAFGYMMDLLLGIPHTYGVAFGAAVVILYSSLGGMKAVVANDTLHFCVLIVALPLVFLCGLYKVGGTLILFQQPNFDAIGQSIPLTTLMCLFLSFFFGETLVPPYVQRLLIGRDASHTKQGTLWSGLLSIPFFLMIGMIGLIAHQMNPSLDPNLALFYVIQTAMPIGLKGFAIAGMIAVIMSSADSFLNAAGIAASHDVVRVLRNKADNLLELRSSRITTFIVGVLSAFFAAGSTSVLDILLYAYSFWTPFILVPLTAGILGVKKSKETFWISSFAGIAAVLLCREYFYEAVDPTLMGVFTNACIFFVYPKLQILTLRRCV